MKRFATGFALSLLLGAGALACDSAEKKSGAKDVKADDKKNADGPDKSDDTKAAAADAKPEPAKPVKMISVSLEDAGMDATLQAPEGAKVAEEFGAYTVKAGDTFQLEIHTGGSDLAARKKEIEGNDVNKLKKFHVESDTVLVYETEVMGKPEFHFVANAEIDGAKYYCEDTKGKAYTHADIEAMHKACESLKAT